MTRGITNSTLVSKLASRRFNIVNLVDFAVGSNNYVTDAAVDISFGGNTYTSAGGALSISEIQEENNVRIEEITITISALKTSSVKLFLDNDYIDRQVIVRKAILDGNHTIVGDTVIVFDGRLDQPTVQEDFTNGSATVQVKASSHWSDFQSTNGRHTNDSEQQALHTGDTFFEKAAEVNKDVKWGRE
tara:strand:+ start:817 stop:1380 length:564 start_codon:yes stop_codon:yes gene_type:complete